MPYIEPYPFEYEIEDMMHMSGAGNVTITGQDKEVIITVIVPKEKFKNSAEFLMNFGAILGTTHEYRNFIEFYRVDVTARYRLTIRYAPRSAKENKS